MVRTVLVGYEDSLLFQRIAELGVVDFCCCNRFELDQLRDGEPEGLQFAVTDFDFGLMLMDEPVERVVYLSLEEVDEGEESGEGLCVVARPA